MFKNKFKKIVLILTTMLVTNSFAQEVKCNLTDNEFKTIVYKWYFDDLDYVKKNLKDYCYNTFIQKEGKQKHSFIVIDSIEDLEFMKQVNPNVISYLESKNNYLKQDILSLYLTRDFALEKNNSQFSIDKEVKKEFGVNISDKEKKASIKIDNKKEKEDLLIYLANYYVKNKIKSKDVLNRDAFGYAVYMLEPKVLEILKQSYKLDAFLKGKDLMSSFHLGFIKRPDIVNLENLKATNDILVNMFEVKYLPLLMIQNLSFVDYMEIMKENNVDLYEKLQAKINNTGNKRLIRDSTSSFTKEQKENLMKFYQNHAEYGKKLKE